MHFKYDVFMCHSSKDKVVARRLANELKHAGVEVWFDEWKIQIGDDIAFELESAIEQSRSMIILMSRRFFESDWTQFERSAMAFRDPSNRSRTIFPVLVEPCTIPSSLARLRRLDLTELSTPRIHELITTVGARFGRELARVPDPEKADQEELRARAALREEKNEDVLEAVVSSAISNPKCVLLFFDVDGFTNINARHGKELGERVLATLGQKLLKLAPADALVARWRGDEFVCVVAGATEREGLMIARSILTSLHALPWHEMSAGLFVTVSCGVSAYRGSGPSAKIDWIERGILGARACKPKGGASARIGQALPNRDSDVAKKIANPRDYLDQYSSA